MAVNALTFNQLATVLTSIVAQATGKAQITAVDESQFVSVAQIGLKTGYDPLATAVSQVLSSFPSGQNVYMCLLVALVVVILHNGTALCTGYSGATLMKLPRIDRRSITIEVGIQNSGLGLALLLNPNIFSPDVWSHNGGMVIIVALWGVWHIISGLTLASLWRWKGRKEATEE